MTCLASFVTTHLAPLHKPNRVANTSQSLPIVAIGEPIIADLSAALQHIDPDPYNEWIAVGHGLKELGEPGRALFLGWSALSPKFNRADAERAWASFNPSNTSYRAIFAKAQSNGWQNPGQAKSYGSRLAPVNIANLQAQLQSVTNGGGRVAASPKLAWPNLLQISAEEWQLANATPGVIIEYLIYRCVGTLIAAGGTGKTTFIEWLAIHVILGIDFAGRKVAAPGRVVLLTAEDSREMLVARLRSIFFEMFPQGTMPVAELDATLNAIRDGMVIIDVSANVQRLTCVERDVVRVDHAAVDALTALIQPLSPSLVVIDPAVSFGVGESRVNDAEQGLIEAARRIRSQNNCAVFYVHHTGKANGREKAEDQYAGRGGSAFADGSRMVFVLNRLDPTAWQKDTGMALQPGETGLKLSVAKLSYARPQAPIYLVRKGYRFEHVEPVVETDEDRLGDDADAVFDFLSDEQADGRTYSRNKLEKDGPKLSRQRIRNAVAHLIEAHRVSEMVEGRGLALIPTFAAPIGEGA